MDDEKFTEMAKSLGCVLLKDQITQILLGEQWTAEEIEAFIEKCRG